MPARLFLCLFYGIPEYLACFLNALLVCMGIHSQSYGFIRVTQLFRYAGYIGTVGDCHAGEAVAEFVRV